jgi:hypothetical protein
MNEEEIHEADKFIDFRLVPSKGKTVLMEVFNIGNEGTIGYIKWYGAWRHYCFFPHPDTIFSDRCMCRIGIEIEKLNKIHKERLDNERGYK